MIHQPLGGAQGQASDIAIVAEEILKTKKKLNKILAENSGQPLDKVEIDTDRDYYMTADDVAKALKISKSFAYKVIRKMNAELQEQGFFTMAGKVNKQFFLDKTCYDAAKLRKGSDENGCL